MTGSRTPALLTATLLASGLVGCAAETGLSQSIPAPAIDCPGNARALWDLEPTVQHREGHELHQFWLLADRPDLWRSEAPAFDALLRYRQQAREVVGDTSPLGMIQANLARNSWLEREHPAEGRITRLVADGVGVHRPMNCLESHLLAYQAGRFPLFEHPTEVVALILRRSGAEGDSVKVYLAADDDTNLPKATHALAGVESDLGEGWRFDGVFHNHTFDHDEERGLIPVAAPSRSDVEVSVALHHRLGLERIFVSDGFSTLELTAEEVLALARAAGEADPASTP